MDKACFVLTGTFLCSVLATGIAHGASASNPDISLILDGRYLSYANDTHYELPGFLPAKKAGRDEKGFQLGPNELTVNANIDDMFYGNMTSILADHKGGTEVTLQEAYIETLALGAGATFRAGRFLSGIGYLNGQHSHTWDFTDAPLIYRGLFGEQLRDDGVQLSWTAPTEHFFKLGAELTRGAQFPAGGASNDGHGANAIFAKWRGTVGAHRSWQVGISHWSAKIEKRFSGANVHASKETSIPSFTGDSTISGIDFALNWATQERADKQSFKFQAEYFLREEEGVVTLDDGSATPVASRYKGRQLGWYAQTVYLFMPRWRVGLRYDQLNSDNKVENLIVLAESGLDDEGQHPRRTSIMMDYSYSEHSRIRLQLSRDESYADNDDAMILQYVMNLGTHGTHPF